MEINKLAESLSPNERKIIPYLKEDLSNICKKSNLDKTSVLRALEYLKNKKILELSSERKKIVELGVNGALYKKRGLPERRLINALDQTKILNFKEAQEQSNLKDDEFKAALGALKKKAMIDLKKGKILLTASKEEIAKKSLEEVFLEDLPKDYDILSPEQLFSLKNLQSRKDLVQISEQNIVLITLTELGKKIMNYKFSNSEFIEQITQDILKKDSNWKSKKFRRYDVVSEVPLISGGKRHFVNQATDYARKIWTEMGFKEMNGNMVQSSFWNFDVLFTAQDHPVREMQDTFFIDKDLALPDEALVKKVKECHEKGVGGSKGWRYIWQENLSKKAVLRTHTTCLSAQTLSKLDLKNLPQKFFALGKNFRNETVDWSHGFEFYQTEGIVIDKNANFRNLLGYLKQFYKKMGFEKIRFRPAYFPYTEPSVEIDVWHPEKQTWLELGGAGMFRPEITIPLLGEHIPILAWGQGFDRIIMDFYQIKDLRQMYKNNFTQLRKIKHWTR